MSFIGILVHAYVSNTDRIKCVNIGERLSQTSHSFSGIFASVLGGETSKQDRPVSWDMLLISLLKLLVKLVQTPLPNIGNQTVSFVEIVTKFSWIICSNDITISLYIVGVIII